MKKICLMALLGSFCFFNSQLPAFDDPEMEHECTSWMVFSDLTGNNTKYPAQKPRFPLSGYWCFFEPCQLCP